MELAEALKPSAQLLIKLGSIIVHYEEMLAPGGHGFDKVALDTLLADPEVKAWMEAMDRGAFLPVKRS